MQTLDGEFASEPQASTSNVTEKIVHAKSKSVLEKRKFQTQWLSDLEWLLYDEEEYVMICKYCSKKTWLSLDEATNYAAEKKWPGHFPNV